MLRDQNTSMDSPAGPVQLQMLQAAIAIVIPQIEQLPLSWMQRPFRDNA